MQVVTTLVDGMVENAYCNYVQDVMYLPISMGYRTCYKRYMACYLVTRGGGRGNDGGIDGYDNEGEQGNNNGKLEQEGLNTDDNDCDNGDKVIKFQATE